MMFLIAVGTMLVFCLTLAYFFLREEKKEQAKKLRIRINARTHKCAKARRGKSTACLRAFVP